MTSVSRHFFRFWSGCLYFFSLRIFLWGEEIPTRLGCETGVVFHRAVQVETRSLKNTEWEMRIVALLTMIIHDLG